MKHFFYFLLFFLGFFINFTSHSQDIGKWEKIGPIRKNNEPTPSITSVCAINDSLYWISAIFEGNSLGHGGRSVLMKSSDAGKRWDSVPFPNSRGASFLQFLGDKFAIATVGFDSGVYITQDGGISWRHTMIAKNIVQIVSCFIKDSNHFYIACHDNDSNAYRSGNTIIAITSDRGKSWRLKPVPNSWVISMKFYDNYGVLACKEGSVFLTQNNGKDFQELKLSNSASPGYNYGSALLDSNNIVIGASDGSIYFSNDFGKKWIKSLHGLNVYHMNTANSSFIIAGSWASLSISNDKGMNWTSDSLVRKLFNGTKSLVTTSSFTKTGIGLIAGWDSVILKRSGYIRYSISRNNLCISDTFLLNADIDLSIVVDSLNPLIVELSDSTGLFNNPIRIGTFSSKSQNNKYVCTILESVNNKPSDKYKVQLKVGKRNVSSELNVSIYSQPNKLIQGPLDLNRNMIQEYSVESIKGESYSWVAIGDVKIVGASNDSKVLVQTNSDGKFELKVKTTNAGGCTRETSQIVSVYGTVSINENYIEQKHNSSHFTVYPNPMNEFGSVMIKAFIPPSSYTSVSIVDMLGKNLITSELDGQNAYREIHVPISTESLVNGIYMIQLRMDGTVISKKLIINR